MFSGLSKYLKIILPKSLFYRSLIIVAAPIIILQMIVTIVFFDSVWIKVNKGMTRSLVGELKILQEIYLNDNENIEYLTDSYKNNFDFEIRINENNLPATRAERKFSPIDRSLRRELKSAFGSSNYWFDTTKYKRAIEIKVKAKTETIEFIIPKDKIMTSSFRIFIMWLTLPSLILILIAIIFLKNQTRPIVNLARAAEKFGKGDYVNEFRPSGASEIRKAAYEFDRMAKRINRHLNQRSEMLSGISHDLRTPLTRLKLQLALLKQKDVSEKMSRDIDDMEKMLNDYLQYAKTQSQEETEEINLKDFFLNIKKKINNDKIIIKNPENQIYLKCRQTALERSFNNIIQNGLTYGEKIYISFTKTKAGAILMFEDDGPGVPEDQYRNIFKPFFRIDKSRSLNTSGVGLGLAITEDIINSHGGNINLSKSKYGGLLIKIFLPF